MVNWLQFEKTGNQDLNEEANLNVKVLIINHEAAGSTHVWSGGLIEI